MEPSRSRMMMRRVVSLAGLCVLLAAAATSLTQCRIVDDRLTGVRLDPLRRSSTSCVAQCQATANAAIRAESELHVSLVKACNGDPVCLAEEEARHEAAVASIQSARGVCVAGCHSQGGGQGND